jgi:glycosyltransferase involved in cell wall biosynthesis
VIGLLIPAYNAGRTVGEAVRHAAAHVPCVLVVDDGSADDTSRRAAESGARVVAHGRNRGKGAALRTGFETLLAAGAEAVITMDADLQHDPADIPRFIERWRATGADLVLGSREAHFASMSRGRQVGNRFSCRALRFFSGLDLPDSQSGFRLYGSHFLRGLTLKRDAYDAEVEALLRAVRARRRIETIPIHMVEPDGAATSFYRPWLDTYRICRTVVFFSICEL